MHVPYTWLECEELGQDGDSCVLRVARDLASCEVMHVPCTWLECEQSGQMETAMFRECLVGRPKHNCLHLSWLFAFQSYAGHMHHFAGCLVTSYPQKLFCLQLLESSHSLFITQPLQLNPTINIWYKRLNKITNKFDTELKLTKYIVVNYNFTLIISKVEVSNDYRKERESHKLVENDWKTISIYYTFLFKVDGNGCH